MFFITFLYLFQTIKYSYRYFHAFLTKLLPRVIIANRKSKLLEKQNELVCSTNGPYNGTKGWQGFLEILLNIR